MPTRDLTLLSSGYTNTQTEREQIGFYVQDQIAIDRLQLIASGRYDDYQQDSLNKRNGVTTPLSQNALHRATRRAVRVADRSRAVRELFRIVRTASGLDVSGRAVRSGDRPSI